MNQSLVRITEANLGISKKGYLIQGIDYTDLGKSKSKRESARDESNSEIA